MRNNAKGKWVDEWMACGDGARGDTLGEVFKDVDTGSLVNAHDTAVPLLRHAPTHLESADSPVIRVRGVRRTNTRPKDSISSQSSDRRGGPVAAFSHLVSLCARKTAPSTTNGAGALSLRERMRMEGRGREGMKGNATRKENRI